MAPAEQADIEASQVSVAIAPEPSTCTIVFVVEETVIRGSSQVPPASTLEGPARIFASHDR
jgi:hypothetical protein